MTVPSDREMFGKILMGRVAHTAATLRRLADEFDGYASDVPTLGSVGNACATDMARRAVHSLAWGMANANMDGIVAAAADYDKNAPIPRSD